ncbi:hypothetical protein ACFL13_01290 [Patescibacteria group bacterium]
MSNGSDVELGSMDASIRETDLGNPEQEYHDEQEELRSGVTPEEEEMEKRDWDERERKKWDPEAVKDDKSK